MAENDAKSRMNEITEKLEAGLSDLFNSEKYKSYLTTMSKFHSYSFNNTLLIAIQRPDASLVAGYGAWQKNFERHVKKGAKGIKIISPLVIKQEVEDKNADKDGAKKIVEITKFKVSTVFDVSDTEGKELPRLGVDKLTAGVDGYQNMLKAIESVSKVPIEYMDVKGEAKGFFSVTDNKIVIKKDMPEAQTVKTLVHELAHSILHSKNENAAEMTPKDKRTKEVEAESVAYAVCQYFGIDTSEYSFGYIAGWSSNRDMDELKSSMMTIRRTASNIIYDINTELAMGEASKEMDAVKEERVAADAVDIETVADKKPSVLEQLKEKFTGKNKGLFSKKIDEPSI